MVGEITAGHSLDARLNRRLKRRVVANQRCKSSCRSIAKKNAQEGGCGLADEDYWEFLNSLPEFVEDSGGVVEAKFVDFGHNSNGNGGLSRCEWLDGDVDPVYKTFFQHLTKEGKSYKLEMPSVNGMEVCVKYEEEEHLFDGPQSSLKNYQKGQKTGTTRVLRSAPKKAKIESPEKSCEVCGHEKKPKVLNAFSRGIEDGPLSGSPAKESTVPLVEEEYNLDCAKPISPGLNRSSNTMTGSGLLRSAKRPSLLDSKSDVIDEDYKTFLTDFLYDDNDDRLVYTPVDGRSVVYEDDESTSESDSEVVMMDADPCKPGRASFRGKSLHTAMDLDSGKCLQCPRTCKGLGSNFRERLMKYLRRPYDQNEYNYLLEEASFCRERIRWRELRNGVLKSYPLGSCAKSYLDLYDELAIKIGATPYDCPRILNLLRGFFYWLQNLSHEDSFQPWMDPSCLSVLPQA